SRSRSPWWRLRTAWTARDTAACVRTNRAHGARASPPAPRRPPGSRLQDRWLEPRWRAARTPAGIHRFRASTPPVPPGPAHGTRAGPARTWATARWPGPSPNCPRLRSPGVSRPRLLAAEAEQVLIPGADPLDVGAMP